MKFVFNITEINRELLIKAPYAALDGNLTILIKHSLFFDEEGISLLELAIHITGWLSELEAGIFVDFDYSSDEYGENPVLYFSRIDNQHYTIRSAWVDYYADNVLSLEEITHCFKTFLKELDNTIQLLYGVGFADMPLFNLVKRQSKPPVEYTLGHFISMSKKMLAKLLYSAQ